jgi:hypothetical protein
MVGMEPAAGIDPETVKTHADRRYAAWLRRVDERLEAACGVGSIDLPDVDYRAWHDDGLTPSQAARAAFRSI